MAGAFVSACVFPEYNIDTARGLGGAAGVVGAAGAVEAGTSHGAGAGGQLNVAGAGAVAGTGAVAGADAGSHGGEATSGSGGSASGSGGGGSAGLGGTTGAGGASGNGDAGASAGAGGETCVPPACEPLTCHDGVKNGSESYIDCGDPQGACGDCVFKIAKFVVGSSGNGFAGSAIVTWDATGMVFDFTVVDSTPRNDSVEPWNDDAVEVFLDLNDGKSSSYQSDDFQLIVPRDESATNSPQANANTSSMPVERFSNATGYKIKLTVPWSSIGAGASPPLGKTIGFDLAVDDDSDGGDRNSQIVVFGTLDNFQNTSGFGEIQLN